MSQKMIHGIVFVGGLALVAEAALTAGGQAAGPVGIVVAIVSILGLVRNWSKQN